MKSLEEQQREMIQGCCCGVYFYAFILAVGLILFFLLPALVRLG